MAIDDGWLTTDEACAYLHCTRKALYHYIERGHITAGRIGRRFRFSRASLEACVLAFSRKGA